MKILNVKKIKERQYDTVFEIENFIYWCIDRKIHYQNRDNENGNLICYENNKITKIPVKDEKVWNILFDFNVTDLNYRYRQENTKFYVHKYFSKDDYREIIKNADKIELEISDYLFSTHQNNLNAIQNKRNNVKQANKSKPKIEFRDKIGQLMEVGDLIVGCKDGILHIDNIKKLNPVLVLLENGYYVYRNQSYVLKPDSPAYAEFKSFQVMNALKNT